MKRLVIVSTMLRGIVDPREELPMEVEEAILSRQYLDACAENEVVWARTPARKLPPARCYEPSRKIERMLRLAGKVSAA